MSYHIAKFSRAGGSALVITLIVIVVLSVIVTSFMVSMSIERLTSQSYADLLRAELAAEAGFSEAVGRIAQADLTHPVAAYEEHEVGYKGATVTAPFLALVQPNATWDGVAARTFLSGTQNPEDPPRTAAEVGEPPDFTTDINAAIEGSSYGWIGLRDSDGARRIVPTEWIYLRDDSDRIVGRYTFWVDDESARIDMQTAGGLDNPPADVTHRRKDGHAASEIAVHDHFVTDASASEFLTFRQNLGKSWRGLLGFLQTPADVQWKADLYQSRASMGWGSKADERGALGVRKLNLNDWVAASTDFTTPAGRAGIAEKVVALGEFIDTADPTFGTRFFDGATGAETRQYATKLAANIHDYIDADHQPTVIRHNLGGWQEPPDPTAVGEGIPDAPPVAFGKEVVPAIGEYVGYYYNDSGSLRIDHTFETWNIHTKPIEISQLGNVRILMAERNEVTPYAAGGTDPSLPGEPGNQPLVMAVPNISISAGGYALMSTLLPASTQYSQWVVNTPQRIALARVEPVYAYGTTGLRMEGDQLATSADVDTEIVVFNQYGYLDIHGRVAQQGPVNLRATDPARALGTQSFGNGPTGSGNNAHRGYPLDSGDPRSFTEVFDAYSESSGTPSAVAWRRNTANSQGATRLGGESYNSGASGPTSGIIPDNSHATAANYVAEPIRALNPSSPVAADSTSVIRDGPLRTIGELGFIYDPSIAGAGYYGTGTSVRKRAGFRTLSVGSKLGEKSGPNFLTQVDEANRASRLLELFTATNDRKGILLNSALRDPANLALKATLRKLNMQTNSAIDPIYAGLRDPNFEGNALSVDADAVILALQTHAKAPSAVPFLFAGQMGDIDIFNTGKELFGSDDDFSITAGTRNKELLDRGREEVFRHLVGLLAIKGSTYRVYTVGQTGFVNPDNRFVVKGTHRSMRVYEFSREYPEANPLENTSMPELLQNNKPTAVSFEQRAEIKQ